jgi:hypothetical protein
LESPGSIVVLPFELAVLAELVGAAGVAGGGTLPPEVIVVPALPPITGMPPVPEPENGNFGRPPFRKNAPPASTSSPSNGRATNGT